MFDPQLAGLAEESWDQVEAVAVAARPKCCECDRPLSSRVSQESEIGPCCAAKVGRRVIAERRARRA